MLTPSEIYKQKLIPNMGRDQVYQYVKEHVPHVRVGQKIYVHVDLLQLSFIVPNLKQAMDKLGERLGKDPAVLLTRVVDMVHLVDEAVAGELAEVDAESDEPNGAA
jgi:hypothetical protein